MPVTYDDLAARHDFTASTALVEQTIARATETPEGTVRFIGLYTHWNGFFGSGVASLAGKVGRARGMFFDPEQPIRAVADRSVYVASHVFDAARDEFDDRDNPARDTHRCLAQAVLLGILEHFTLDPARADGLVQVPMWLEGLCDRVSVGYGVGTRDDVASIGRAMGYHLGSEVLAADEFSTIDRFLRENQPALHADLQSRKVALNGIEHNCYAWLSIHSDHGGGVETEHFEHGVEAIRLAMRFLDPALHQDFREQVLLGFDDFARDHDVFFRHFTS